MAERQLRLPERQAQFRIQEENLFGKTGGRLRAHGKQAGRQLGCLNTENATI
jgi:hypothetical protein